jgi:hypothetical protein
MREEPPPDNRQRVRGSGRNEPRSSKPGYAVVQAPSAVPAGVLP